MTKPPWAVRKTTCLFAKFGVVCLVAVAAILVDEFFGLILAIAFAFIAPIAVLLLEELLETHEDQRRRTSLFVEAVTQEKFDSLEDPDDGTLRVIVPKKPEC